MITRNEHAILNYVLNANIQTAGKCGIAVEKVRDQYLKENFINLENEHARISEILIEQIKVNGGDPDIDDEMTMQIIRCHGELYDEDDMTLDEYQVVMVHEAEANCLGAMERALRVTQIGFDTRELLLRELERMRITHEKVNSLRADAATDLVSKD